MLPHDGVQVPKVFGVKLGILIISPFFLKKNNNLRPK